MNEMIIKDIVEELNISTKQVEAVLTLLSEDNTIPFIARYRKEATGGLDEDACYVITNAPNGNNTCAWYNDQCWDD